MTGFLFHFTLSRNSVHFVVIFLMVKSYEFTFQFLAFLEA